MAKEKNSNTAEVEPIRKQIWCNDGNFYQMSFQEHWNFILNKAKELQPEFKKDEQFTAILRKMHLFFWQDPRFEEEGHGSLKKGLFITGNVGVGKTLVARLYNENPLKRYKPISTNEICDAYQQGGIDALDVVCYEYNSRSGYQSTSNGKNFNSYFFDDLGAERLHVNHMGNSLNVMEHVILTRYANQCPFTHTHFTSNLDAKQIEEMYGTRVRSRLREMVNFIEMDGTDRRK